MQAGAGLLGCERVHFNFFVFELFHFDFLDFRFFKLRFSFSSSMIIQYYWWIIQCNECTTTQIGVGVLGFEQDFTLNFLEFDVRIRIRSPSSSITIQYYWWIAVIALLLRVAMWVPMYLLEHHLACDLVFFFFILFIRSRDIADYPRMMRPIWKLKRRQRSFHRESNPLPTA